MPAVKLGLVIFLVASREAQGSWPKECWAMGNVGRARKSSAEDGYGEEVSRGS